MSRALVNCTGPEQHPGRTSNPLLQGLIGDNIARPDSLGLGLAVDSESRVISANGSVHPTLFAVGALTRGTRWEVTAIPEMREQANSVARKVLHDHLEQPVAAGRDDSRAAERNGAPCRCGYHCPMGRRVAVPEHIRLALEKFFGEGVRRVVVVEHSLFARMHFRINATTRRRRIYLVGTAQKFFADPTLMLHEYCHVMRQWEPGKLTTLGYLVEWFRKGYWG
ncbi:MAG: hypothetical protein WDO56_32840 [Gammaproteobacteria bacterium]